MRVAAVAVADRDGLDAVTMRSIAELLGVEAMALYRHVSGKSDLLDSLAEVVIDEVNDACATLPAASDPADWRNVIGRRVLTAREIMLRHPWAPGLISSRGSMGPSLVRYFDEFAGILFAGGFSIDLVHHALHAFGSRALGFSPELFQPEAPAITEAEVDPRAALAELAALSAEFPFIGRMAAELGHDAATTVGWCDDEEEFRFGLDVLLDGLEGRRLRAG